LTVALSGHSAARRIAIVHALHLLRYPLIAGSLQIGIRGARISLFYLLHAVLH